MLLYKTRSIQLFTLTILSSLVASCTPKPVWVTGQTEIETPKYRLHDIDGAVRAELEINVEGTWKRFGIIDGRINSFKFEYLERELNGAGSKELVLKWKHSNYGSGGGNDTWGIQVWDIDTATRLLNEITYCAEQSFGRGGATAYIKSVKKEITIRGGHILVAEYEYPDQSNVSSPPLPYEVSRLKAGKYSLKGGMLKYK